MTWQIRGPGGGFSLIGDFVFTAPAADYIGLFHFSFLVKDLVMANPCIFVLDCESKGRNERISHHRAGRKGSSGAMAGMLQATLPSSRHSVSRRLTRFKRIASNSGVVM